MDQRRLRTSERYRESTFEGDPVRTLEATLRAAADANASDIHLEPQVGCVRIRIRVDGRLRELQRYPLSTAAALVSRLKILAHMDIAEKRLPQDGRLDIVDNKGVAIAVRASTLPTIHGEKVVLRLLRSAVADLDLDRLGMNEVQVEFLRRGLGANTGMIVVTGPTGSGKSTTLYAALNELNDGDRNVVTVEDPVERRVDGVNQVQVNDDIGLTFAGSLRAFLRQDPDVIMVGEIRDRETAEIAVRAALTGHLVLTTLHTNDAAASVARLVDMGVAPFLVAASIRLVVAQRLLRTRCAACEGASCEDCGETGLRGRIGVFEVLPINERIRRLVAGGADADEIRAAAVDAGMPTLARCADDKVALGITSAEEALRCVHADLS